MLAKKPNIALAMRGFSMSDVVVAVVSCAPKSFDRSCLEPLVFFLREYEALFYVPQHMKTRAMCASAMERTAAINKYVPSVFLDAAFVEGQRKKQQKRDC